MNTRSSYRDQRFSSTSYGWKAPIAGQPPGVPRSRSDTTPTRGHYCRHLVLQQLFLPERFT